MTPTSDTIDNSAIYVWQSSTGTFHVIDMIKETDVLLPTNAPALQPNQPCSGCHRISRDGKRFSYTFNGGNFDFGALAYDATAKIVPTDDRAADDATARPTPRSTRSSRSRFPRCS